MELVGLEKFLVKYLSANEEQKKQMDGQIDRCWSKVSKEYDSLCDNDKKYNEVFEKIKEIHKVTEFSIYDLYSEFIYNEEFDDHSSEFQEKEYEDHRYIYENFDALTAKVNEKIEKLKRAKIVFNKESRINQLEKN